MKVSLNWAQNYSNVDLLKIGKETLVKKIGAQLGAIDEVVEWGSRYDGIVVAKVIACQKHTDADKLSICLIDDGNVTKGVGRNNQGFIQVVCGASNVAEDQLVAYIPPGVKVPATATIDPYKLEVREIRGVTSSGMIASPSELGINNDHNGILVIEPKEAGAENAKPGFPFKQLYGLDDTVIDIENKMFTHRPDAFGMLGIAREIAGIQGLAFKSPDWYIETAQPPVPAEQTLELSVNNSLPELVPRFVTATIADVRIRPSPYRMQATLNRVGIRPVNNIVDITNFVMMLTGQPLHAYDYDKVRAIGATELGVRFAKPGEELAVLGNRALKLGKDLIVITANDKAIGLGGVIGGTSTEVDEHTKNIILEAGTFDMNATRQAAMTYGLFTDAAVRFTKGQSPRQNMAVMIEAIRQMIDSTGGSLATTVNDIYTSPSPSSPVSASVEFINSRLGLELPEDTVAELLRNVEFELSLNEGQISVTPPFWRIDIEIAEDLVEEVGRLHGYDHLPLTLPEREIAPANQNRAAAFKSRLRDILIMAGGNEVLTYSFVHGSLLEKTGQNPSLAHHIRNSLSPDLQYFRLSLTPSLLDKIHPNLKLGYEKFALFEIGKAHNKMHSEENEKSLPKEINMLALIVADASWESDDGSGAAFYQAKTILDYLGRQLSINLHYSPIEKESDYPVTKPYDPKRSALVSEASSGQNLGIVGEFRQAVAHQLKLPRAAAGFEISINELLKHAKESRQYLPIPRFPKVQQDITLSVATDLGYGEFIEFVNQKLSKLKPQNSLLEVEPTSIYKNNQAIDRKHITLRITLTSYERTLKTEEVNKLLESLAAEMKSKFGAEWI